MTKDEESLLVNLYDWCTQTTEREIGRKCETLSRLSNSLAAVYVELMASLGDKASTRAVALALVKRFHLPALKLKGEEFTAGDQQLTDEFVNFARFKRLGAKSPVLKARKEIGKGELSKVLKSLVEPLLGKEELLEGGVWRYETVAEPFRIATYIDIGGRIPLRYSHKIIGPSGPLCDTSLLHWHGIATVTAWDSITLKDLEKSVKLLAELCTRFLAEIQTICIGHSRWRTNG